jgi:site-specific recombinase XerD
MNEKLITPQTEKTTDIELRRVDQHPVAVYLARLAPRSRIAMASTLNVIVRMVSNSEASVETFPWQSLRYQHISALRSQLAEIYSPSRANGCLAALRGVMKECWQLGLISADGYSKIKAVPPVRGERLPKGRALSRGEIRTLFQECAKDQTQAGARDAALLAILYGCGLRRSEAVALDLKDYDQQNKSLKIRAGKGNKERMVYLTSGSEQALNKWLVIRGTIAGPIFFRIIKGDHITNKRLSDQAIMWILKERAESAGVTSFSPHDLRRTFIGDLLDAGADISTVQQMAGHSQVTTTARYDRRGETAKRKASDLLFVPFE